MSKTPEMAEKILDNIGKMKVADHARLLGDNQKTLDRTSQAEELHRDYGRRVREAQARSIFGSDWEPPMPTNPHSGDDQMQIFIDSPITVTHPGNDPPQAPPPQPIVKPTPPTQPTPPTPPPQQSATSKLMPLWPWFLAAATGYGAAVTAYVLTRPDPPPAAEIEFPPFPNIPWFDVEKWEGPGTR